MTRGVIQHQGRRNQLGMVSFLVVMIMMMVITLIVVGFTQVTNQNRREALDRQLSNQAFYAAESGVNSVISSIKQRMADSQAIPAQTTCTGTTYSAQNLTEGVGYTCLLVDPRVNNIEVTGIETDVPKVIPVQAVDGAGNPQALKTLTFEWTSTIDSGAITCTQVGTYPASTPDCPALLRLDITRGTANSANALKDQTTSIFLQRAASPPTGDLGVGLNGVAVRSGAGCVAFGTDNKVKCTRTIQFGPTNVYTAYIRALTIYKNADNLKITGTLQDDTTAYFNGQVKIDVTGKAQDVLRRIQVRVNPENMATLHMPTSAIFSEASVCKRFVVGVDGTYANNATECEDVPPTDEPDAGIGGCSDGTPGCPAGGGGGVPVGERIFYSRKFVNMSNNPSSNVAGCTWSWGDGTSNINRWCYYKDVTDPPHTYPKTYPGTSVKCYIVTIKLTIRLNSGTPKSTEVDQKITYGADAPAYAAANCGGVYKRMP